MSEVVQYARKRRHAALLEKVTSGKALTASELTELEEFEEMAKKAKQPEAAKPGQKDTLSPKEESFCIEFVKDNNGLKAAIRAGYSKKTAGQQASRLLKKVKIQSRINQLKSAAVKRAEITLDKVIKELALLATSNMADYVEFGKKGIVLRESTQLSREAMACIAEVSETRNARGGITIRFKLHDKAKALDSLKQYFVDNPTTDSTKKIIKSPLAISKKK